MKSCNVALIGISGFGREHLDAAIRLEKENLLCIKAVCDTNQDANAEKIGELAQRGVNYYRDYLEMLRMEKDLDMVVVSTPIHLHKKMAVDIMERGIHVLLEKPPAVTIQDIDCMIEVSQKTGKLCAVNFMLTSGQAFLELKRHVANGDLGTVKRITGVGLWKRLDNYYSRTPWAGKLLANGDYVLDGSLLNPFAHLVNNMLFLANASGAGDIHVVTAELYHAHRIDCDDTACLKVEMKNGNHLYCYITLCSESPSIPYIFVEGTHGKATWNYKNELEMDCSGQKTACKYNDEDYLEKMYRNLCDVIHSGKEEELYCSIASTRNFVLVANGAFESSNRVHDIPSRFIKKYPEAHSVATEITDISEIIAKAASDNKLFAESGVEWAIQGKRMVMDQYKEFRMFMG